MQTLQNKATIRYGRVWTTARMLGEKRPSSRWFARRTCRFVCKLFRLLGLSLTTSGHSPILLTAIVLVMLGTGCDLLCASSQPKTHEWSFLCTLKCFSLARNTRVVFHIRHSDLYRKSSHRIEHRFTYLHGVRTLFIVWIIIAHSCSLMPTSITMPFSFIARHPHDMIQMFERNQTFGNFLNSGTLAVEAFFLIR